MQCVAHKPNKSLKYTYICVRVLCSLLSFVGVSETWTHSEIVAMGGSTQDVLQLIDDYQLRDYIHFRHLNRSSVAVSSNVC